MSHSQVTFLLAMCKGYIFLAKTFLFLLLTVQVASGILILGENMDFNNFLGPTFEYKLQEALLSRNLSRVVLPVAEYGDNITVKLQSILYSLVDVDERAGYIEIMHYLYLSWYDFNLTWDPEEYGGIDNTQISAKNIWIPDIIMINQMTTAESAKPRDETVALVFSDGTVIYWYFELVRARCHHFDLSMFPFDEQMCGLGFTSLTYGYPRLILVTDNIVTGTMLSKRPNTDYGIMSYRPGAPFRDLFITAMERADKNGTETIHLNYTRIQAYVVYNITIARKSSYYITTVCLPTAIVTTVCLIGLFGPFDIYGNSEERVTLGLTTLLAMTVLQGLVASEVPRGGGGSPLLGNFIIFQLLLCAIATVAAALIMALHQQLELCGRRPPKLLTRLVTIFMRIKPNRDGEEKKMKKKESTSIRLSYELKKAVAKIDQILDEEDKKHEWLHIFRFTNLLCFIVFTLINIIVSSVMLSKRQPHATLK